jgi:hypothetical protein
MRRTPVCCHGPSGWCGSASLRREAFLFLALFGLSFQYDLSIRSHPSFHSSKLEERGAQGGARMEHHPLLMTTSPLWVSHGRLSRDKLNLHLDCFSRDYVQAIKLQYFWEHRMADLTGEREYRKVTSSNETGFRVVVCNQVTYSIEYNCDGIKVRALAGLRNHQLSNITPLPDVQVNVTAPQVWCRNKKKKK